MVVLLLWASGCHLVIPFDSEQPDDAGPTPTDANLGSSCIGALTAHVYSFKLP